MDCVPESSELVLIVWKLGQVFPKGIMFYFVGAFRLRLPNYECFKRYFGLLLSAKKLRAFSVHQITFRLRICNSCKWLLIYLNYVKTKTFICLI